MERMSNGRFSSRDDQKHGQDKRPQRPHGDPAERHEARPGGRQAERVTDRERRLLRERARRRKLSRRFPERGVGDLRAALVLPLLDIETLSFDVHHSWRTLFPDAEDAADEGVDVDTDADFDEAADEEEDGNEDEVWWS